MLIQKQPFLGFAPKPVQSADPDLLAYGLRAGNFSMSAVGGYYSLIFLFDPVRSFKKSCPCGSCGVMAASKQELSEERTRKLEIDKEITRFFDERPEIIAVSLFGSRARGRAKETSDVDLAILLDPHAKVDEFELKRG
jgi:hypothetical protein